MSPLENRHIAIVVDDAEKVLHNTCSRNAIERASANSTIFTPATSVNILEQEQLALRSILANLAVPVGLHAVLDEDPQIKNFYPPGSADIVGNGGLLHIQREAYESGDGYGFGLAAQALTDVVINVLEQQIVLFQDIFKVSPEHLSYHNGWGFSQPVTQGLMTVAATHNIPVRLDRRSLTKNIQPIQQETGPVLDSHNIPHMSPPTTLGDFANYVDRSLLTHDLDSSEVLMHVHANEVGHAFYAHHGTILSNKNITAAFAQKDIALVAPRHLISR